MCDKYHKETQRRNDSIYTDLTGTYTAEEIEVIEKIEEFFLYKPPCECCSTSETLGVIREGSVVHINLIVPTGCKCCDFEYVPDYEALNLRTMDFLIIAQDKIYYNDILRDDDAMIGRLFNIVLIAIDDEWYIVHENINKRTYGIYTTSVINEYKYVKIKNSIEDYENPVIFLSRFVSNPEEYIKYCSCKMYKNAYKY